MLALRDGTRLPVREIRAEDAPALRRLVERASARSRELRFFGPIKELSDESSRRFAEVDGWDRFALVALDPENEGEVVAVVRYEREGGEAGGDAGGDAGNGAEYAALVEDRFQGRGLGAGLTRCLIRAARERGVRHLHALVMRENRRMLGLLRGLDLPGRKRWTEGYERVEIDLEPDAA